MPRSGWQYHPRVSEHQPAPNGRRAAPATDLKIPVPPGASRRGPC